MIFFPTFGYRSANLKTWVAPVHAWAYRPEKNPRRLAILRTLLRNVLKIPKTESKNPFFLERSDFFLAHNVRHQRLEAGSFQLLPSDVGGHVLQHLVLPGDQKEGWHDLGDASVQLLEPQGRLVVSDIDDTLKITEVHRRAAMMVRTFLKPFEPVPGLADVYQRWDKQCSTAFCYVSASPWQLYPSLNEFLKDAQFPRGVLYLKRFRLKDRSFFSLFASPVRYKTPILEQLVKNFPERTFILVGDSGEKDPEIYGAFARKYPRQVDHIYIRQLTAADLSARLKKAFVDVPANLWSLFRNASEIS